MSEQPLQSHYQELEKPIFQSKIPDFLQGDLDGPQRYMVEQLSIIGQQNEWLVKNTLEHNRALISTDLRLQGIEFFKDKITSKTTVIGAILFFGLLIFSHSIVDGIGTFFK